MLSICEAVRVNPLIDDRDVEVILDELLDLTVLHVPYFADHDRETYELVLASARALARDALFPAYRTLDEAPPTLANGKVTVLHSFAGGADGATPNGRPIMDRSQTLFGTTTAGALASGAS